jgi:transmembrane sensor
MLPPKERRLNWPRDRKILIQDPALAGIRIGGNFRTDDADAFLWLLQSGFPIKVEQRTDRIILSKR